MLAGHMLRVAARRFPRRIALIDGERRIAYADLDAAANRFADALIAGGHGQGTTAAIMLPNSIEYAAAFFGAARAGTLLAHLSYRYARKDIVYVLDKIGARLLVCHADFADQVADALPDLPRLERIVVVGGATDLPGAIGYDDFVAGRSTADPAVAIMADDPYAITFTGGTTGFPKAVVASHRARAVSATTIAVQQGISSEDKVAIVTPMFHAAGLFVWFVPAMWLGCTCSLLPAWDVDAFMDLVARDRITAAFLVPTQLNGLAKNPRFDAGRLATLRNIGHAGSPMAPALADTLRRLLPAVEFTENYGQSETGPMTVKRHWEHADRPDSVGRSAFNVETDVFAADGTPVAPGEIGEIVTRGEHLLTGYFDDPEQTAALFKGGDGWLWTGDLGYRDAEGFITLVDRSKDMIISGAENIYPKEIEDALYRHDQVVECAVFGVPDEHWGEVPAAHVVIKAGCALTADELVAFTLQHLARYKRPRLIEFVDAIPKTPVGKIQKHLLRAPYWAGRDKRI